MEETLCLQAPADPLSGGTGSPPHAGSGAPGEPQGPGTRRGRHDDPSPWPITCEDERPGPRLSVCAGGLVTCLLSAGSWYALWTGGQALLSAI